MDGEDNKDYSTHNRQVEGTQYKCGNVHELNMRSKDKMMDLPGGQKR